MFEHLGPLDTKGRAIELAASIHCNFRNIIVPTTGNFEAKEEKKQLFEKSVNLRLTLWQKKEAKVNQLGTVFLINVANFV